MAVYIGKADGTTQLISSGVSKRQIVELIEQEFQPSVGAIKYLARRTLLPINVTDSNFDGWVYANGTSYSRSDFPTASAVFGMRFGGDTAFFRVPDMCRFVKPSIPNSGIIQVQSSACIPKHMHSVNTKITYTADHVIKTAFTICQCGTGKHSISDVTKGGKNLTELDESNYKAYIEKADGYRNYVPALHGGNSKVDRDDHQVMTDLNVPASVSFNVVGCGYTGDDHPDAYPPHVRLQVMVYIGRRLT